MKKFNVTIAGGGSTYTPGIVMMLLDNMDRFPIKRLTLYDIDEKRQSILGKALDILISESKYDIEFNYTTDPREAFTDIDFCMAHIRTGQYKMRELDEKIPLEHGLVGQETCGPGGLAYGLRSIPDMIELIDFMEEFSPNAWMLNYSNPASIVAEACRVLRPNSQVLNICDMPVGTLRRMGQIIGKEPNELNVRYFGLNHFGWWTSVKDDNGYEYKEEIIEYVKENGYLNQIEVDTQHTDPSWQETHKKARDLIKLTPNSLPNTYLQYYLYPDYIVETSNKEFTRANEVMAGREKDVFTLAKEIIKEKSAKNKSFKIDSHASFVVDLARAIAYNTYERMILIVENNGAISNLPDDAMVEVPCLVSSDGPEPLAQGPAPLFELGMIQQQLTVEKLLVEAYIDKSYLKLWQAFTMSKTVPSARVAKEVLDDLMEANKEYWPEFK